MKISTLQSKCLQKYRVVAILGAPVTLLEMFGVQLFCTVTFPFHQSHQLIISQIYI